jgi:nucleoid-associated protein YgaU
MSILNFIEEAGEKLLSAGPSAASPSAPSAAPSSAPQAAPNVAQLNAAAGAAISKYVASQGLHADDLNITYDGASKTVTVTGVAPDQATKEKIALCCGNVHSVSKVDDQLTVAAAGASAAGVPASSFYQVKSGDTLSKIAKQVYGDSNAYMKIFEANKPMLSDPNRIYPGQQLRIPPK